MTTATPEPVEPAEPVQPVQPEQPDEQPEPVEETVTREYVHRETQDDGTEVPAPDETDGRSQR